eukprot:CAMPEP_0201578422 /NCGR_PEP_ID=MMETSP0190_2-20130828/25270_1 /ASSEMBLY_ACC=CAM_ASM_000263 /TAXON_ID=37353 /ORGANISM="Rosalina sp." /LENGTH=159 /DNA_ID=CAMNT_0048011573 /DNA_START=35 /DNA_END=514 /DNA_ORIENTATION=-
MDRNGNGKYYDQDCKCLGLKHDSNGLISYIIDGDSYILERDSNAASGNEVHGHEHNIKAEKQGEGVGDDFEWDNGQKLCNKWNNGKEVCCMEWDQNAEHYEDIIDGIWRYGREAKCDKEGDGDDVQWKLPTKPPTWTPRAVTTTLPGGLPHPEGRDMLF